MSMKSIGLRVGLVLASSLVFGPLSPLSASNTSKPSFSAIPIGTAFSYQGQLRQNGLAANGVFALKFRLYDQLVEGTQVGSEVSEPASNVSGGSFSSELDFGNVFESKRWLEVEVDGTILTPRQAIMPTPTALYALSGNAGPQGLQGSTGPQGEQGETGVTGPTGPAGPAGSSGAPGLTGANGSIGLTGETGPMGPAGAKGDKGDTGLASTVAGPTGATGPQGIQGATGATGANGIFGSKAAKVSSGINTTSTSYTDLTNSPGPSVEVTVPDSGAVLVTVTSSIVGDMIYQLQPINKTIGCMGFELTGANTLFAADSFSLRIGPPYVRVTLQSSATFYLSGLTPGVTTFTAKYKLVIASGETNSVSCWFQNRNIIVIPMP